MQNHGSSTAWTGPVGDDNRVRTRPGCTSTLLSRGKTWAIRSANSSRSACIRRAWFSSFAIILFRIVATLLSYPGADRNVLENRTKIFEDRHNATRDSLRTVTPSTGRGIGRLERL